MREKTVAVLLAVLMVLSIVGPAWGASAAPTDVAGGVPSNAKPAISEEQAVEIVKELAGEALKSDYRFDVYLEERYYSNGSPAWRLNWYDEMPRTGPGFHMYAMVDATTGHILDFNQSYAQSDSKGQVLTRQEALQIAEDFIKKQHPEKLKEVELRARPIIYYGNGAYIDLTHQFSWERKLDGIPVEGDGFNIAVDALTGTITNYHFSWTPGIEKNSAAVLEGEEVKEQVLQNLGITLSYDNPAWSVPRPTSPTYTPVYRFNTGLFAYVNALTGEPLDYAGRVVDWEELIQFKQEFTYAAESMESGKKNQGQTRITADAGLAKAQEFFTALGKSGKVVRSGGGTSSGPDGYYSEHWSYSIEPQEQDARNYSGPDSSVGVDVFTGEVVNYHKWEMNIPGETNTQDSEAGLTRAEAQKKAEAFISKVRPQLSGELVLTDEPNSPYQENNIHNFNWSRLVNGIPFARDGVRVSIDVNSGEVISYNYNWSEVNFAAPQEIITPEEAKAILAENMEPVLTYVRTNRYEEQPGDPVLVYRLDYPQGAWVEAESGKLVGNSPAPADPPSPDTPTNAVDLLRSSGRVPADATEDSLVTRRQALTTLMAVRNAYPRYEENLNKNANSFKDISADDPDWRIIEGAVQNGVLSAGGNFNPDAKIDRETLAIWAVRALNYGSVAELPLTIELPVKDARAITQDSRNFVGLALGLGVVATQNGNYEPKGEVTWKEFADTIIKSVLHNRSRDYMW